MKFNFHVSPSLRGHLTTQKIMAELTLGLLLLFCLSCYYYATTYGSAYLLHVILLLVSSLVTMVICESIFAKIYKKNPIKRRTMIILTNSIDAYKLASGGVKFQYFNVGGMRFITGRTKIARAVSVTPEERKAFKDILAMGIDVKIQMIPRDEIVDMKDVVDKDLEGGEE